MTEEYVTASGPPLTRWQKLCWTVLRQPWCPARLQRYCWQEVLRRPVERAVTIERDDGP